MGQKELTLLQEQTILSRERTMQQYIATGLAFIGIGLIVIRFFEGQNYFYLSLGLVAIGFWQVGEAYTRFRKYREIVRKLRRKEKKLGLEVGE